MFQFVLSADAVCLCLLQSRSIRDFDNHATCLVGKYEVGYILGLFSNATSILWEAVYFTVY